MDAAEAAAMQSEQEVSNEEIPEQVENTDISKEEEVELPSDEVESDKEPTIEELREQIKGLEAKVKKGADKASQRGQEEKAVKEAEERNSQITEFFTKSLSDMIENGINDEHFAEAEEMGMTPEQLELQVLKTEKIQAKVFGSAGGKENYEMAIEALTDVYPDAEKEAFSEGIMNPALARLLVKGLMADYNSLSSESKETNFSNNAVVPTKTSSSYNSQAEFNKDMAAMRKAPSSQQARLQSMIDSKLERSDMSKLYK